MHKILLVDDDHNLRMILLQALESCGYEVVDAKDGMTALESLKSNKFDLLITDLQMPGMKGIELLEKAREIDAELGCLVITAYGTVETAVEAMQKGAFDFITKPFSISHLQSRIERYFEYQALQNENKVLKRELQYHKKLRNLVGQSEAMQGLMYHIDIVAQSDATVFIRGDSGTGKELIAEAIHNASDRRDKPFLKINCAAVPESLFESTLFGHEKGSFSGAYKMQKGIFEECDGGTLLLDEISEIPIAMQAKLLRVLQEMKIIRVGSTSEIPIDVRIIATSNRNMESEVAQGSFPITVPSLEERLEDLPLLLDHFINNVFKKKYKYEEKQVGPDVIEILSQQSWQGNIRQLEHTIERAILFSGKSNTLKPEHFQFDFKQEAKAPVKKDAPMEVTTLAEMEKRLIYAALKKANDHRNKAAEMLDISVRTLRNKLAQYENEDGAAD